MARITLGDLKLALERMLADCQDLFRAAAAGALYERALRQLLAELEQLPAALTGLPLTDELELTDELHDDYGRALFYLTEAILHVPVADPAVRASAERVREAFIPRLADLREPYATEAAASDRKAAALATHKADLERLIVPGGTAYDWATAFVAAGQKLDALLFRRGEQTGAAGIDDRRRVGPLLQTGIGLVGRFRTALRDEIESGAALPRDAEARLFGHYDELARMRATQGRRGRGRDTGTPDAPDAPVTADPKEPAEPPKK